MTASLPLPRLIMFDLDGTLIDTAPDLTVAVDQTLMHLGRSPVGEHCVRGWLGKGFESLLRRALSEGVQENPDQEDVSDLPVDESLYQQAAELFPDIYMQNLHCRSEAYPGVFDCLRTLQERNVPMVCVTNKNARFSEKLLHSIGMTDYFSVIVSGDSLPKKKPDPDPLLWVTQKTGVMPSEALMVGDSDNDVKAARAAGSPVVGVSYGYCRVGIHALQPDAIVDSLADLPSLLA